LVLLDESLNLRCKSVTKSMPDDSYHLIDTTSFVITSN
jgi:hypothetical protein